MRVGGLVSQKAASSLATLAACLFPTPRVLFHSGRQFGRCDSDGFPAAILWIDFGGFFGEGRRTRIVQGRSQQ